MANQILHTKEIGAYLRTLIWDNLKDTLSLKACQLGDVSFYATPDDILKLAPIVLVRPAGVQVRQRTLNFRYDITYKFRIVFVTTFLAADAVVSDKLEKVTTLADLFFDNPTLSGFTAESGNCKIIRAFPTEIEYDPTEDGFLAFLGQNLMCGALNVEVMTGNAD